MNDKTALGTTVPLHRDLSQRFNYIAILFILLSVIFLCGLWIGQYQKDNYDDKAVHYYSACRLFARPEKAKMIEDAQLAWMAKLPPEKRFRTNNRLSSFRAYLLPSAILRLFCEKYRSSSNAAPSSFSRPFKNAMLSVHILALCLILVPAFRSPVVGGILMLCLVAASFGSLNPVWLAPTVKYNYHYLYYVSRCSAIFILSAAFLAYVQRQWITAAIMLLLIFSWHAGSGLIWCPLTLAAWGLSNLGISKYRMWRIGAVGSLIFLGILFVPFIDLLGQARLWLPLGAFYLAVAVHSRLPQSLIRAMMSTSAYLFLTQLFTLAFDIPAVREWFILVTANPLVATMPDRLEGTRHIASIALLTIIVLIAARIIIERYKLLRLRAAILVGFELVVLLLGVWTHHQVLLASISGSSPFFEESDDHIERVSLDSHNLSSLEPNQEEVFFASLGDFFIISGNETQNNATPSERKSDEAEKAEPPNEDKKD